MIGGVRCSLSLVKFLQKLEMCVDFMKSVFLQELSQVLIKMAMIVVAISRIMKSIGLIRQVVCRFSDS